MKATPEKIVAALLTEPTMAAAAQALGISEVTLWRRLQDAGIRDAYRQARRQVVEHAVASLQRATGEAVETLRSSMNTATDSVRVRAACAIVEYALRSVELDDLTTRIEQLEAAVLAQSQSADPRNGIRVAG